MRLSWRHQDQILQRETEVRTGSYLCGDRKSVGSWLTKVGDPENDVFTVGELAKGMLIGTEDAFQESELGMNAEVQNHVDCERCSTRPGYLHRGRNRVYRDSRRHRNVSVCAQSGRYCWRELACSLSRPLGRTLGRSCDWNMDYALENNVNMAASSP